MMQPNESGAIRPPIDQDGAMANQSHHTSDIEPVTTEAVHNIDSSPMNRSETPGWWRRNLLKISLGAFVVGSAAALATEPLGHLEKEVTQVAPWAAAGIGVTESMWIAGAALMAGSAGKKIGNPLKLRSRWDEISTDMVQSPAFKAGLAINSIGALGTAAVVVGGATALPAEMWPGAFGIAAADMASTVALRSGLYMSIRNAAASKERLQKPVIRPARLEDVDQLVDLDLRLFRKAYGASLPPKEQVADMLTHRLQNPSWTFVAEVDGKIEGFVNGFPTNATSDQFTSWEQSTANGTLDGKVDIEGKYGYVTNMTISSKAVERGAEEMLIANLFAKAMKNGLEYAYFVSRMPGFKTWLNRNVVRGDINPEGADMQIVADRYAGLKRNGQRYDPLLKMYENMGFTLERVVPSAFEDDASANFGVVCKVDIPPTHKIMKNIKPLRHILATALGQAAKHPQIIRKLI